MDFEKSEDFSSLQKSKSEKVDGFFPRLLYIHLSICIQLFGVWLEKENGCTSPSLSASETKLFNGSF